MEEAVIRLKKRRPATSSRAVYESLTFLRKRLSRSTMTESTTDVDAAIRQFRELGGPQCLLRIVRDYNTTTADSRVLDVALSVMGNCSLDYETRKIVGRLHGVQHVVKILESYEISKLSLLNRTCRTLANLALDDRLADDILKSDAMKFIVELLEFLESPTSVTINSVVDVPQCSHLKQSAVRSIRVLAATPARRVCVVRHGAVRSLGKLLVGCADKSYEDEELVICILRALVVTSVNCSLEFTEQMQSCINGLETLVKLTSSDSEKYRDPALNVLANLSCQASMRPLLGNAGAIDSLVRHLADGSRWETATSRSPGWQWAVDALCQCTRESVNRVKMRESNGGLGHLVRLLGEPFDGRLWLCGLSALINFFYDDVSFSRLVDDEPLVDALLEKFSALARRENAIEHDELRRLQTAPTPNDEQVRGSSPPNEFSSPFTGFDRECTSTTALHNSHVCCFSPENSPPYLTSFASFPLASNSSSPHRNQGTVSPSGMSPARDDFSPQPSCDVEEFCYSPVYESEDSDEDDGDTKNNDHDADACKSSENSVVSETQPDVVDGQSAINVDHSMGSRSPIGDILLLLSKLSLEEKPRPRFFCLATLDALIEYVVAVESPHPRAKRILSRIARNPLCFERLVTLRWIVSLRKRLAIAAIHSSDECAACDSVESFGLSLLNDLKLQAESPFGIGVLLHLILAGKNSDEKVSALLTTIHLVRVPRILHKILFLDAAGLTQVMTIMANSEHVDHKVVFDGFVRLAQEIVSPLADPVDVCPTMTTLTMHCHYGDALLKSDDSDADLVRLTTDGGHQSISAHRSVLSNACDVFRAMFDGSFAESRLPVVAIGNASFDALQYVVHHIYSCSGCPAVVNLTTRVLLECLELADKLLMCDVKKSVCECLMRSGRHLPSPKVYSHAKLYDCPSLSLWVMRQVLSPKFPIERRLKLIGKMMSAGFLQDVSQKFTDAIIAKTRTSLNAS